MYRLHVFASRLLGVFSKRRREAELNDEVRAHLELLADEYVRRGMPKTEARASARRDFGGVDQVKESYRDQRGFAALESLLSDLRYAVRGLRNSPGFAFVAVFTLALGIGANTAIFSLINTILLRPLPFHDPDRLVMVWEDQSRYGFPQGTPAPANFLDWKAQNHVFDDMAAMFWTDFNLTGNADPERVKGLRVTADFFPLLGVDAIAGRTFLPQEDSTEAARTVVLSHGLWQRRFNGDPGLVGRDVAINGARHTVVGIMPRGFQFPSREAELWVPAAFTPSERAQRDSHYLMVVARLKTGTALGEAQAEMSTIAGRLEQQHPVSNKDLAGVRLVALREQYAGGIRVALTVLLATVGAVLLIACANVAHLLLARGAARRTEIGVRSALGAGRGRIVRQLLAESLVLVAIGEVAGVTLSTVSFPFLVRLIPESFPQGTQLSLDFRVLAFTTVIALATVILFGVTPALQATGSNLSDALKAGGRGGASANGRLRTGLVVVEMTLTVLLLVGAGLLLQSYWRLRQVDPGFRSDGLLTVETVLSPSKYAEGSRREAFVQEVLERVRALPGVVSSGYVNYLPLTIKGGSIVFSIDGRPIPPPGQLPTQTANNRAASADYLRTMGIPLLRGRLFDARDGAEAPPVVVINETMARTFWPNDDPVGQRIRFGYGPSRPGVPNFTVVGVAGDVKQIGLDAAAASQMYFPFSQLPGAATFSWPRHLVVRTKGDPMRLAGDVRRAIAAVDPEQPASNIRTMNAILDGDVANRHTQMTLLGAFAVLALVLASVGLYGVLSYVVVQRTREIGLRMALGASHREVVGDIVRRAIVMTVSGIVLGLGLAFASMRVFSMLLFRISPTDPLTFAAVTLLLMAVAGAASYLPARRATRVDPLIALRHQ
jgi:putative ABC transport system permease protein